MKKTILKNSNQKLKDTHSTMKSIKIFKFSFYVFIASFTLSVVLPLLGTETNPKVMGNLTGSMLFILYLFGLIKSINLGKIKRIDWFLCSAWIFVITFSISRFSDTELSSGAYNIMMLIFIVFNFFAFIHKDQKNNLS